MTKEYLPLYAHLATAANVVNFLDKPDKPLHSVEVRCAAEIEYIEKNLLPSGSGFDKGVRVEVSKCRYDRLVLRTAFHHMDEHGSYDNWTDHEISVTPTFLGCEIKATGRDRNGIKEYIEEAMYQVLSHRYHLAVNTASGGFTFTPE